MFRKTAQTGNEKYETRTYETTKQGITSRPVLGLHAVYALTEARNDWERRPRMFSSSSRRVPRRKARAGNASERACQWPATDGPRWHSCPRLVDSFTQFTLLPSVPRSSLLFHTRAPLWQIASRCRYRGPQRQSAEGRLSLNARVERPVNLFGLCMCCTLKIGI